jgi:hypothetical protein
MSVNQIKVSRKQIQKSGWNKRLIYIVSATVIILGAATALAFIKFSDKFAPLEIVSAENGQIIRVPRGGNLQAAINRAQGGDIIELQAGETYYGEIKLPKKALTDFITIQTSAAAQLPADKRVSPANANLMAKIVTRGQSVSAVSTENGANHYRFVGIEFAPDNADYIYNLIYLGTESDKVSDVPRFFELDRCYLHSYKTGVTRRGIALNSADTIIKNSYLSGFAGNQQETQAIAGWTGTKNVKIINNYLEGGAENLLFGGADPASAELIPSDIEVRGNYFFKPSEWFGKNTIKNAFELKNARRVQFVGNYLQSNQAGAALTITVRNQDGKAPFSTIEDVLIKDNVIESCGQGINILGSDDVHPSQTLKRLNITGNLFLDITNKTEPGTGYFVQISGGEDVLIANNTVFNEGNMTTLYGDLPKNFLFRDNIVGHGNYGIHGHPNIKSAQRLFQNNVIVNNRKIEQNDASFPSGNFWTPDYKSVGFIDSAQNDFRLAASSRFKGKGKDKSDIGSNINLADYQKVKTN